LLALLGRCCLQLVAMIQHGLDVPPAAGEHAETSKSETPPPHGEYSYPCSLHVPSLQDAGQWGEPYGIVHKGGVQLLSYLILSYVFR
jgi:hypothetical protein